MSRTKQADGLAIAGLVPFSTCDWPGRIAAVLFLQGCPWRCTYCHNTSLLDPRVPGRIPWSAVLELLDRRRGLLDGVVFSGGEPTRQAGLADAMRQVRERGFGVGLHTAGAFPDRLAEVLPLVDWVGLDVKAPPDRYPAVTRVGVSGGRAWCSVDAVLAAGVDHEMRMTVDPTVHSRGDVVRVARELGRRGARPLVLQQARPDGADPAWVARLGVAGLAEVVPDSVLPHLERRGGATQSTRAGGVFRSGGKPDRSPA